MYYYVKYLLLVIMRCLLLPLLLVYLINFGACEDKYTTKYDGINLEEILTSERLLAGYVKCLLEEGPCTPDGKELKRNLPDAIENDCAKCTSRQREGADQVMHYIIDHRPADWDKLEVKYQSDGTYKRKYLESKNRKSSDEKSKSKDDESKDEEKGSKED